jgi:hypothetical protein
MSVVCPLSVALASKGMKPDACCRISLMVAGSERTSPLIVMSIQPFSS